jgi:hypothetical protein
VVVIRRRRELNRGHRRALVLCVTGAGLNCPACPSRVLH